MKSFIISKLNNIRSIGKQLDLMTFIKTTEWVALSNDKVEVEKYLFLENSKLVISVNGQSTYSTWNYISINSSLVIENAHGKIMFKIIVCNSDILVINIDSTNKYCFLINSSLKDLQDFESIQWYLIKKCGIDILSPEQKKIYKTEQELQRQQIEIEKEKEQEEDNKNLIRVLTFIGILVVCSIIVNLTIYYIEYKKDNTTIYVTESQNTIHVEISSLDRYRDLHVRGIMK